jgi:hypothetical protein
MKWAVKSKLRQGASGSGKNRLGVNPLTSCGNKKQTEKLLVEESSPTQSHQINLRRDASGSG